MKLILTLTMLLSSNLLFARTTGEIRFGDGSSSVRITVGNDNSNGRELVKRIKRLERAVGHLQMRVYELEDGNYGEQNLFVPLPLVESHLVSTLLMNETVNSFDLYKKEKVTVCVESGRDAESISLQKLRSDRDILVVKKSTLNCFMP